LQTLGGVRRAISLGAGTAPWPAKNRYVFYSDARYSARLPEGDYDLIVSKVPEYSMTKDRFRIRADETTSIKAKVRRSTDMSAKGWYSGEDHIHYARENEEDAHHPLVFPQAEDHRIANILQMGNVTRPYFPQRDWKPVSGNTAGRFVLVPGQEAPR